MLNPWLSLSLDTARLALKLTRIMTGVVPNSTRVSESEDCAHQVSDAIEVQAPVAEAQERPIAVAAHDSPRRSMTKPRIGKTARAKVGHAPKPAAPRHAAAKQAVPKFAALPTTRSAAAARARSKTTQRSAVKKK
jgi:hypothetical protein